MSERDLTIVVPTFNERENVEELIRKIDAALTGIDWEIVFVDDDSPDGTAELVFRINHDDPRVRGIKRIGRRGLSSACIEGICSSSASNIAVMDADLQHDETALPAMLKMLNQDDLDLVVGSRFTSGGSTGGLPSTRVKMSKFATFLGTKLLGVKTTDPMSGFFMLRRSFFYDVAHDLSGKGFKILLDIFASSRRDVRFGEVPYEMRAREHGESKLDMVVLWEYLLLLLEKSIGKLIPVRFIFFVMIGLFGSLIHLAVLLSCYSVLEKSFLVSQSVAVAVAMTVNFFFNNLFTYSDRRLRGLRMLRGLVIFYLSCASGAAINIAIASYLYDHGIHVALAGLLGAGVGAVWNYTLSTQFAWKPAR